MNPFITILLAFTLFLSLVFFSPGCGTTWSSDVYPLQEYGIDLTRGELEMFGLDIDIILNSPTIFKKGCSGDSLRTIYVVQDEDNKTVPLVFEIRHSRIHERRVYLKD